MFGSPGKIKFSADLWERIKLAAEIRGGSSPEEFVERIVAVEVDKILQQAGRNNPSDKEVEDITNKLKGLGYLE